jgi:hypothetical protein
LTTREQFINKIRALGYSFKRQAKRVQLYRKQGGTHRIAVPQSDLLEDEFVESALKQAGCPPAEIRAFLSASKS